MSLVMQMTPVLADTRSKVNYIHNKPSLEFNRQYTNLKYTCYRASCYGIFKRFIGPCLLTSISKLKPLLSGGTHILLMNKSSVPFAFV